MARIKFYNKETETWDYADVNLGGGYYTPITAQPNIDTMQIQYIPSAGNMPSIDPVSVTLPTGPKGDPGSSPHIGANGNWWIDTTDTGISASGSGGNFIVELTIQDYDEQDGAYSCVGNKTPDEINAAIQADKIVSASFPILLDEETEAPVSIPYIGYYDMDGEGFFLFSGVFFGGSTVDIRYFSNEVAYGTITNPPTELPNPEEIIFKRVKISDQHGLNSEYGLRSYNGNEKLYIDGIPNPYSLTINDHTYDGSEALNITEIVNAMIDAKLSTITNAEEVKF